MSGHYKRVSLARDIARVLRRDTLNRDNQDALLSRGLLVTGVALAVMQAQPASALALGEMRVQSAVGQPFVGSTTARLGPGESLAADCISAPRSDDAGLTQPDGLTVTAQSGNTPGSYPVQIRSAKPLYEPMYEIRLRVDCPGSVALSKSYVVMLNLPMTTPAAETAEPSPISAPAQTRSTPNRQASRPAPII